MKSIVSFSLYGNATKYFWGMIENVAHFPGLLPGFLIDQTAYPPHAPLHEIGKFEELWQEVLAKNPKDAVNAPPTPVK